MSVIIRGELAERILAIQAGPATRSPNAKVVAMGTQRRIQALIATGWAVPELAACLNSSPHRLTTILCASRVTARTAQAINRLYDTLWDRQPPTRTTDQRDAVIGARQLAKKARWVPPLAWDNIDTDPEPVLGMHIDAHFFDEIAVDRAVHGDHIKFADLTPPEQAETIRRLTEHGRSIREIAYQLATTERTVARRRAARGDVA